MLAHCLGIPACRPWNLNNNKPYVHDNIACKNQKCHLVNFCFRQPPTHMDLLVFRHQQLQVLKKSKIRLKYPYQLILNLLLRARQHFHFAKNNLQLKSCLYIFLLRYKYALIPRFRLNCFRLKLLFLLSHRFFVL